MALALGVRSQWPRALRAVRLHLVEGIRGGRATRHREIRLPLDGTEDWSMPQALARWGLRPLT